MHARRGVLVSLGTGQSRLKESQEAARTERINKLFRDAAGKRFCSEMLSQHCAIGTLVGGHFVLRSPGLDSWFRTSTISIIASY